MDNRAHRRPHGQVESQGGTVLVVDDDPSMALEVAAMVEAEGWDVRTATTWSEALRVFLAETIDLVITDAVMPTVDGSRLAKLIRSRSTSFIPILMLTSLVDEVSRQHAVASGIDDVLSKPPNRVEIRMRVQAFLRIRHLTRELERKQRELEELAHRDALTGLANRRRLDERLQLEVARSVRYGHPVSLVVFDLDHFKQVNDSHGHGVGDRLLSYFGQLLGSQVREVDLGCRMGGEEFVLVLPDTPSGSAITVAERIRRAFEATSGRATEAGPRTLSAGVSSTDLLPPEQLTAARLLQSADEALYAAKRSGRNRYCVFGLAPLEPH